jgi:hypothetical protein
MYVWIFPATAEVGKSVLTESEGKLPDAAEAAIFARAIFARLRGNHRQSDPPELHG